MEEHEFERLLDLFPEVRSRDYRIESDQSRQSTSQSMENKLKEGPQARENGKDTNMRRQDINIDDTFWEKLKQAAEKKLGAAEAARFCSAFQQVHNKLVFEALSMDAARHIIDLPTSSKD